MEIFIVVVIWIISDIYRKGPYYLMAKKQKVTVAFPVFDNVKDKGQVWRMNAETTVSAHVINEEKGVFVYRGKSKCWRVAYRGWDVRGGETGNFKDARRLAKRLEAADLHGKLRDLNGLQTKLIQFDKASKSLFYGILANFSSCAYGNKVCNQARVQG